ncbi:MAG: hypothetical protein AAB353_08835 [Candidatus Hydrogenedentota bacterium]
MKNVLKFGMTAVGLLLILIGVAAIVAYTQVDRFGYPLMADALSEAFGQDVSIVAIRFAPMRQSLIIEGMSVANPPAFKDGDAIQCDNVEVFLDPKTMFAQTPVIRKLQIEGADFYYRHELNDGINITQIMRNAEAARENKRLFYVKELVAENAEVHFSTNLVPIGQVGLNVVNVHLKDLAEGNAIGAGKVVSVFLRSVIVETLTLKGLLNPLIAPLRRALNPDAEDL